MRQLIFALLTLAVFGSCSSGNMSETPDSQFEGNWKLTERSMFEGIEIEISKDEEGNFIGIITKLNENKYVLMFMEVGDKFLTDISRRSNFEFTLKEKKIAHDLFSTYGQSTTEEYKVQFENKNRIILGKDGSDGAYVRIK